MVIDLLSSVATFKTGTAEKVSFILLELVDLGLTHLAVSLGLSELNPIMSEVSRMPTFLFLLKVVIPVFIAWLVPRKLLWPSLLFVTLVVCWDLKEMAVCLF